jgi:hypothetical protein
MGYIKPSDMDDQRSWMTVPDDTTTEKVRKVKRG